MDVQFLKDKLLEENRIVDILTELGCHHIKQNNHMVQCANPDGDNPTAICVYLNENLTTINYTRQILPKGQTRTTDILDLVSFIRGCSFVQSLQWICNVCGYDYYEDEPELPYSLQILHILTKMNKESSAEEEDNSAIKPIDPRILDYYLPVGNVLFEKDGISLSTQRAFGVGYDPQTNRITIPIYSELGDLVGIKGRIFQEELEEGQSKYMYLMPCNKGKILYGLNGNIENIVRQGRVFVGESEKFCMQLYEMGYYGVATGGAKITKYQINMLTRLGVQIIFAYDKDIDEDALKDIADRFMDGVPVYAIIDKENILEDKESPSDNPQKWEHLIQNNIYQIK